jgi:hypothetical protein
LILLRGQSFEPGPGHVSSGDQQIAPGPAQFPRLGIVSRSGRLVRR